VIPIFKKEVKKLVTASQLFAGSAHIAGMFLCYYCGASCDDTHKTSIYVKETFTNRDIVLYPNSLHICQGCIMSLGNGWADMPMIDGSVKSFTTARGMAPRMYSWLLTQDKRLAFTKAHISTVRDMLTDYSKIPEPPFALILSESGQKQLIFRAPVAHDKKAFSVMLEDKIINLTFYEFKERMKLASNISIKIGKPVLKDSPTVASYISANKAGIFKQLEKWQEVKNEPLSQLAAWLAPPKGE
jgi:hypothetical protein